MHEAYAVACGPQDQEELNAMQKSLIRGQAALEPPPATADALSLVLDNLRLRGGFAFILSGADQSDAITIEPDMLAFHYVTQGRLHVAAASSNATFTLEEGDLLLVSHAQAHLLSAAPVRAHTRAMPLFTYLDQQRGTAPHTPPSVQWTTAFISLDLLLSSLLVQSLPPFLHLQAVGAAPRPWLQAAMHFLHIELNESKPGSAAMVSRLIDILFIRAIREWSETEVLQQGVLRATVDQRISRALAAVLSDLGRDWSIAGMAQVAALSPSAFAARFSRAMGQTANDYLLLCRIERAMQLMRHSASTIAEIALAVGYGNEASFARAFRRKTGLSPSDWRETNGPLMRL